MHPLRFASAEIELGKKHLGLARYTFSRLTGKQPEPVAVPESDDRRFLADDWRKHVPFDVLQQVYLINSGAFLNWVENMDGRAMAFTFNLLRENDLFWSYWTNNYLKGLKPAAFDLLYWNTDGTNLPYRMHSYYLREMYLHNRLVQPDALKMNGETINLSEIRVPSFFLSARQDHIAKWKTTYHGAHAYGGDVRFVLSGAGQTARRRKARGH